MRAARTVLAGAVALTSGTTMAVYGFTSAPAHRATPTAASGAPTVQAAASRTPAVQTEARLPARSAAPSRAPAAPAAPARAATITRAQVIARAGTWHPHTAQRVPYSQLRTHGGYRTDCSGYASMALALGAPGPITVGLATPAYTTRIAMSQLQEGDLVIDADGTNNTRHVVIFVRWTSARHTAYWEYEQRGGYGTDYRTNTYGLAAGSQYHAYRPKKIR